MYKNTAAHLIDALHKKTKKETNRAPLGTYISGEPMERVAVDICGPLLLTKQGNTYILVISDLFTKWTEAIAIPNQERTTICQAFVDSCITKYGTPLQIHSDQGSFLSVLSLITSFPLTIDGLC